ncbi:hypothetical protein BUALT_Bualt02G0015600 [Buddleja alternifolia]|uniref:Uncharacterized protein n=1 Tax=Buddleja alternifolia TaxID=168488 RepID=A0AAV6Y7A5_9LAMI|nr:hypothetical protein BUALT_Bualt02G0015600 [Buddleja alternifolia]
MRVLFCKIHCPFICFCKPSAAAHLYTSGPLKLENTPHHVVPSTDMSSRLSGVKVKVKVKEESVNGNNNCNDNNNNKEGENVVKSCIRKIPCGDIGKKKVQWLDDLGKELAEIKEFESRITTMNEMKHRRCDFLKQGIQTAKRKTAVVFVSFSDASIVAAALK